VGIILRLVIERSAEVFSRPLIARSNHLGCFDCHFSTKISMLGSLVTRIITTCLQCSGLYDSGVETGVSTKGDYCGLLGSKQEEVRCCDRMRHQPRLFDWSSIVSQKH
jgi:hypothetical protein